MAIILLKRAIKSLSSTRSRRLTGLWSRKLNFVYEIKLMYYTYLIECLLVIMNLFNIAKFFCVAGLAMSPSKSATAKSEESFLEN